MVLYPEGNVQGYQQFCLKLEEGGLFKSAVFRKCLIEGLGLACTFNFWWRQVTWPYSTDLSSLSVRQNRGKNNAIWSKNFPKLHCFGIFAGARTHHQGLKWLKPRQFKTSVYRYCEFDKLWPAAQFQLLAVVVLNNTRYLRHGPCDQKIT